MKIKEMFTSRKFYAALGAVMTSLGAILQGSMPVKEGILAILGIVVAWIFAQSKVDAAKVNANPTRNDG